MADPLSLLRQYNVNKREIVEKNNYICFGEYCWPKTVKTNYLVWGSSKDGPNKEYYTLECLLFILRNVNLQHPVYVKQAAAEGVPVVRRPDRKDLLAYLFGESAASASIDRSAPLELPVPISEVLKSEGSGLDKNSSVGISASGSSTADDDGPSASKISRLDVMQRAKEQFSARLDAPKIKKAIPTDADGLAAGDDKLTTSTTSLKEAMSIAQISALKAKRLAKKRSTIIDAENQFEKDGDQNSSSLGGPSILLKYDADFTREIQSKERIWRNRTTILQSSIKNFSKSVFPLLQSIKSREEGTNRKPGAPAPPLPAPTVAATPLSQRLTTPASAVQPPISQQQQQYNRYDQERFYKNDHSSIGFRIDTTGTYHGLTLKSVTEGSVTPKTPATPNQPFQNQQAVPNTIANNKSSNKRTSKTPIIIIPATTTSLITMYNAKAILQDLRYVEKKLSPDQKRETETLIQRRKSDNTTVPYRVIDNPHKLAPQDWERVVAVFVQGPAWQFKGWPWDGNPVEIFARIKAFHLKWDEMKLDANVAKWSVDIIELSRTKRHLDRANLLKFWSNLDAFMIKHKHYLRF